MDTQTDTLPGTRVLSKVYNSGTDFKLLSRKT